MSRDAVDIELDRQINAAIAAHDPWTFISEFARTIDEHDQENPVGKPFPRKAYIRLLCRFWKEVDVGFIEKSRQIMCTWTVATLDLWDVMFNKGRRIYIQSKKQEDANDILERARFVYDQLIATEFPNLPVVKTTGAKSGTNTEMEFQANKSTLIAIPQGGDVVRGPTTSRLSADEVAFQPEAADAYRAILPSIKGGGHYLGFSTANGKNFHYRKLYAIDERTGRRIGENIRDSKRVDTKPHVPQFMGNPENPTDIEKHRRLVEQSLVDMPDEIFNSLPFEDLVAHFPGMRYWQTCEGVHCLRIHYSADPDKSKDTAVGRQWIEDTKRGCSPNDWLREFEIDYESYVGRPVIDSYAPHIHVKKLMYDSEEMLRISFDYGNQVCGATISQGGKVHGFSARRLRFIGEVVRRGESAKTHEMVQAVKELVLARFPRSWKNQRIMCFCDPNGDQRQATTSDRSLDTNIKICNQYGFYPSSKKFGVPESTQLMESVFARVLPDGLPMVLIDEECEYIQAVCRGLHYPEVGKGKEGYYEKDGELDHGADMMRYDIANFFEGGDFISKTVPPPRIVSVPMFRKYTGEYLGMRRVQTRRRHAAS